MKKSVLFIIIAILLLIAAISVTFFVIIGKTDVNTLEFTLFDKKGANLLAVESNDGKWGFINKKGDEVIKCKYDYVWPFSNGLAAVREGNTWTYINPKGMTAISEKYELAYPFDEKGYAVVKKDGKYGVINKRGDMKIENEYDGISAFNEFELAIAKKGEHFGLINRKGEAVVAINYKSIVFSEDGYAIVCGDNDLYGVFDKSGKAIIPVKYDKIVKDMFFTVGPNDAYVIRPYDELVHSDLFVVCQKDELGELRYGYVNKKAEDVIAPQYKIAWHFSKNGLAAVCIEDADGNEKWGYINKDGEFEIEPIFDMAYPFGENDLAEAKLNGNHVLLDKNGDIKIDQYLSSYISPENEDFITVKNEEGLYGIIIKNNEILLDFEYRSIDVYKDHIIVRTVDDQYMLYDHKCEPVNGEIYDKISYLQFGYFAVIKDDKNAVINSDGKVITEYTDDYKFYRTTKDNYILAKTADDRILILNMDGEEAVNMDKYKNINEYNKILTDYIYKSWDIGAIYP